MAQEKRNDRITNLIMYSNRTCQTINYYSNNLVCFMANIIYIVYVHEFSRNELGNKLILSLQLFLF